jgi:hypothetical protein
MIRLLHAEPNDRRLRVKGVKAHSRNINLIKAICKGAPWRAIIRDLTEFHNDRKIVLSCPEYH